MKPDNSPKSPKNKYGSISREVQAVISNLGGRAGAQFLTILVSIYIARIVGPEEMGRSLPSWFAAGISIAVIQSFIMPYIVQGRVITRPDLESLRALNFAFSVALAVVAFFASWAASIILLQESNFMLPLGAALCILASQSHVSLGRLERNMKFLFLARIEFLSAAIGGAVAIISLKLSVGVLAVFINLGVTQLVMNFTTKFFAKDRLGYRLHKKSVQRFRRFCTGTSLSAVVSFASRNLDNLIALRLAGQYQSGIYSRIYSLVMYPITQLLNITAKIYLPQLSRDVSKDKEIFTTFSKGFEFATALVLPLCALTWIGAFQILIVVLGPLWISGAVIMQFLSAAACLQPIGSTLSWVFFARHKTDLLFWYSLVMTIIGLILFAAGASGGIDAMVKNYLIANILGVAPAVVFSIRLLGVSLSRYLTLLSRAASKLAMAAIGDFILVNSMTEFSELEQLGAMSLWTLTVILVGTKSALNRKEKLCG